MRLTNLPQPKSFAQESTRKLRHYIRQAVLDVERTLRAEKDYLSRPKVQELSQERDRLRSALTLSSSEELRAVCNDLELTKYLNAARDAQEQSVKMLLTGVDEKACAGLQVLFELWLQSLKIESSPGITTLSGRWNGLDTELVAFNGQERCSKSQLWKDTCFEQDSFESIVFAAPLPGYSCWTNGKNRMQMALDKFEELVNMPSLAGVGILLFLTEVDVFTEQLIEEDDIVDQAPFADYRGPPGDSSYGVLYFMKRFKELCPLGDDIDSNLHIHVVSGTDYEYDAAAEDLSDSMRSVISISHQRRSSLVVESSK